MKKTLIIFGMIAAILAVILAALPLFMIAFIPGVVALLFAGIAFYMAQKRNQSKKTVQLIFLLAIMAIALSSYKALFSTVEVGDIEELEQREEQVKENALDELDDIEITQ